MKITIKKSEYGLMWGLAAIDRYCLMLDMDLEPALDLLFKKAKGIEQTVALAKFVSCAIESYATVNNTAGEVPYELVLAEFDNQGPELVKNLLGDFLASKLMGQSVSDFLNLVAVEDTGKKNEEVQENS